MQDAYSMTLGMWIDYIIEWNDLHEDKSPKKKGKKEPTKTNRRANQSDFDRF